MKVQRRVLHQSLKKLKKLWRRSTSMRESMLYIRAGDHTELAVDTQGIMAMLCVDTSGDFDMAVDFQSFMDIVALSKVEWFELQPFNKAPPSNVYGGKKKEIVWENGGLTLIERGETRIVSQTRFKAHNYKFTIPQLPAEGVSSVDSKAFVDLLNITKLVSVRGKVVLLARNGKLRVTASEEDREYFNSIMWRGGDFAFALSARTAKKLVSLVRLEDKDALIALYAMDKQLALSVEDGVTLVTQVCDATR